MLNLLYNFDNETMTPALFALLHVKRKNIVSLEHTDWRATPWFVCQVALSTRQIAAINHAYRLNPWKSTRLSTVLGSVGTRYRVSARLYVLVLMTKWVEQKTIVL